LGGRQSRAIIEEEAIAVHPRAPGRNLRNREESMNSLVQLAVSLLLGGVAFLIVARVVPGFYLRGGFGSAVIVASVYGVLKMLLQKILIIVTFPAVLVTLGLFIVVINAFLLWLTDKLVERVEIRSMGALVLGTILLSLIDWGFQLLVRNGAIF
jgi:putative membrane protein